MQDRSVEGEFSLRQVAARLVGHLTRSEFVLDAEDCRCRYTLLGTRDYQVNWGTYDYRRGLSYSSATDEPSVALYFQMQGSAERVVNELGVDLDLHAGQTNTAVVPATRVAHETQRDLKGTAFEIVLSQRYFLDLANRHPRELEALAEHLVANRAGLLAAGHLPITAPMWAIVQRIRSGADGTDADSLLLEAGILELLALQLGEAGRLIAPGRLKLSPTEVERLHAVRDLLLERLDDPPTLAELARYAVTNEFKLKHGFKALFGTSPRAYLLQHRLELARRYILDTDWTIAAIARRVGYGDPAHLTNAFRKRYGVRPSDLR